MATMAENVIAAGSENHPPMLEKGMYDSWKTRIILYIRGKKNGDMLIESINKGPFKLTTEINVKDTYGVTDITHEQTHDDLSLKERFTSELGESIHSYYLRYAKLINDMNMINMSMSNMQINTKFLYAFLKHNEKDVKEVREMRQLFPDPLALLANTYNPPPSYIITVQNVQGRQSQGYAGNARKSQATGATVINTIGEAGANQPWVIRCYNYSGEGHIAKQCTAKKKVKDSEWFKDKMLLAQAQEAGVVLHEKQQDFLADGLEENDYCDDL
ncbi:hypothetical protein Tco_1089102 [Tanacetum coccineum]